MINERYIIKNILGQGRSKVYLCADIELNLKEFALKILPNDKDSREKKLFKEEFFSLKKLDHPLIVKPYDLGTIVKADEKTETEFMGSRYFTLEYFPGAELLQFPGIKDPAILREIIIQICSVLYYLHQSNFIYYDLKPENILAALLNGNPAIKLIDLGLASHKSLGPVKTIKGTAEYIAPEILRKESHDHRADLYSLGILMYRLIYSRFPFGTDNQVNVYKAHLINEFEFPAADYPDYFVSIIQKLLNKDPEKRYQNSLGVIKDLNSGIDNHSQQFIPAKNFTGRGDIINILSSFINDKESTELIVVKGAEDSGKTTLLNQLYSLHEKVIPVFNKSGRNGFDFIKIFLKDIVFSEYVYPHLSDELKVRINNFIQGSGTGIVDEVKSIISQISLKARFILLIDDFSKFDQFSLEIFREIIPILQINYIKVIAAENSESEPLSKLFYSTKEFLLNPFTEMQVKEFLEKSFSGFFPREQLGKIILMYSDLLPGNIVRFINDLLFLKIIKYEDGIPEIKHDETPVIETILKSSQQEIYNIRMNSMADIEIRAAKLISAFEIPVEPYLLSTLLDIEEKGIIKILENLLNKNIIHLNQQTGIPTITSEGFRKYIYSTIYKKKEFHSRIADLLEKREDINRNETARHYELSENYFKCFSLLNDEAENARNMSAFSYQKKIYHRMLKLPLEEKNYAEIKYNLANVHFKLSEFQNCLGLVTELLQIGVIDEKKNELLILKGSCLVELGKYREGKEILNSLISKTKDKVQKLKLLNEIANAEFELGSYKEARKICNKIIQNINLPAEEKGKCYNLMGLTEIFSSNNFDNALFHFEKAIQVYSQKETEFKLPRLELNIGNIFSSLGKFDKALEHWNLSFNLNKSIGNLETEGAIAMNYGIYNFNSLNFDESIEQYKRGSSIFKTIGAKFYEGLIHSNLGEIYLQICEYHSAIEHLLKAVDIFFELNKKANALNSLFFLGKLYYIVGDYEKVKDVIAEYSIHLNGNEISEKQKNNFSFLYYLNEALYNNGEVILNNLKTVRNAYFQMKDELNYCLSVINISSLLISTNKYTEALKELSDEKFINICRRNYLFDAEREYTLGLIAESSGSLKYPLKYFESAYKKIKDAQVTELTWKVLFAIGLYYLKRGNRNKTRDYFYYSKSLIFNFADSFGDKRLREAYLAKHDRKSALEIMLNEPS